MPDAWERQHRESSRAFHAFAHYRDLGDRRSLVRAWQAHRRDCQRKTGERPSAPRAWARMSAMWSWVARAQQWDAEIDRQMREKHAKAQLEARERHQRLAQGALTALTVPVRATLDALQDTRLMTALAARVRRDPNALLTLVQIVARAAQVMPGLVSIERLALGLTTDIITIDEPQRDHIADRITADPIATDLAIELLHRVSAGADDPGTTH